MPIHDFRCPQGHVHDALVGHDETEQRCPQCGKTATQVFLTPPRIDWMAMGAQGDASPEFIDRFEKVHKERAKQETQHREQHGDSMRGAGG